VCHKTVIDIQRHENLIISIEFKLLAYFTLLSCHVVKLLNKKIIHNSAEFYKHKLGFAVIIDFIVLE